jgi:thioredoxin-dependent peroxiredoxin
MLTPGKPAPSFRLESSDGGSVSLADFAGKAVVLYFYPRDNTPGCTIEAQEFRDHVAELAAAGAQVLGVSRDSIASHCKFRDKFGLTFPLLSDGDGAVMQQYQAWGEKVMYGKKVTGVIRSTVVIDGQGRVARHWPKVQVKGHAADVLAFVQTLAHALATGSAVAAPTPKEPAAMKPAKPAAKKPAKPAAKTSAKPAAKKAPKAAATKPAAKKPSSKRHRR